MRPALASAVPLARLSPPPATPPSAPQGDFAANMKLLQRYPPGYDHSYYCISTFMEDHMGWHAQRLCRK